MNTMERPASELATLVREFSSEGTGVVFRATLRGKSMLPFIRSGDVITVRPVREEDLRRLDVLVYQRPDQALVAHRLIGVEGVGGGARRYITRGDSLLRADSPHEASDIMGRVTTVIRRGRTINPDHPLRRLLARGWVCLFPWPQRLGRFLVRRLRR